MFAYYMADRKLRQGLAAWGARHGLPTPALLCSYPTHPPRKKAGTASIFARLTKQIQIYEIENWWGMTAEGFAK